MQIPDLVNASFELFASLMILNNCRVLINDKAVAGVSIVSTVFFTLWGVWNLFYFPNLGQWLSFWGGLAIVLANIFWVFLMFRYRHPEGVVGAHKRAIRRKSSSSLISASL